MDRLDENEFNKLLKEAKDWISEDLDETDFENTPRYYFFSGYDYAFYLFEGNSRNLGAELDIPVDEANEIAQKNGYPIMFIKII